MRQVEKVAGRLFVVLVNVAADRRPHADRQQARYNSTHAALVLHAVDPRELGLQRLDPQRVAARLVRVARVEVPDLLVLRPFVRAMSFSACSTRAWIWPATLSCATLKAPQLERSAGISTSFSHFPCVWRKKSSCGRKALSMY